MFRVFISSNVAAIFSVPLLVMTLASCTNATKAKVAQKLVTSVGAGIAVECIMGGCKGKDAQAAHNTLSFRSACGSPPNSDTTWYSVVSSSQSIDVVKTKYCGDAFITPDGKLQAASFISRVEAEKFADTLSRLTGHDFWVLNKRI